MQTQNSTTVGTNHFPSAIDAAHYYMKTENIVSLSHALRVVQRKMSEGAVNLGKPTIQPGQKLLIHKEEQRYYIRG